MEVRKNVMAWAAGAIAVVLIGGMATARAGNDSAKVCASGGAFGGNAKVCVGTDGVSGSLSAGAGVSAGVSGNIGWNGNTSTCAVVSGTAGAGPMVTGSVGACRDSNGRNFTKVSTGAGVGAGTEGMKLGVTMEVSHKDYGDSDSPRPAMPLPYQMRGTRTDMRGEVGRR